jgi:hypothetical protein
MWDRHAVNVQANHAAHAQGPGRLPREIFVSMFTVCNAMPVEKKMLEA